MLSTAPLERMRLCVCILALVLSSPALAQRIINDANGRLAAREIVIMRELEVDEVVALGRDLIFTARELDDTELFISDGTRKGTRELADLDPERSSNPRSLTVVGDRVFFVADDGMRGPELWCTDGTENGTQLVRDINQGSGGSNPQGLLAVDDLLFFVADDGFTGRELWRSDGTLEGTFIPLDIEVGYRGSDPGRMVSLDGVVYFAATEATRGRELWSSDGTQRGTRSVTRAFSNGPQYPENLEVWDGRIYFSAVSTLYGRELWATDGSSDGTVFVADINPGEFGSSPGLMHAGKNYIFFSANDGNAGRELWCSDGTQDGTQLVYDIGRGTSGSSPSDFFNANGRVLFLASDLRGRELWTTDGTLGGTRVVRDINGGTGSAFGGERARRGDRRGQRRVPRLEGQFLRFVELANGAMFMADDGNVGTELWFTDGTYDGTRLVADINPFGDSAAMVDRERYLGFATIGDKVYFAAYRGDGTSLWEVPTRRGRSRRR